MAKKYNAWASLKKQDNKR